MKYSQTDIIPIRAKVRFSTLIVLPADEEILDFTTGDKDFWIINGTHNLCYLHPAQAGIRSNMNLVTASGHVYSFLLTEISKEADSEPDLKVFVAPNDQSSIAGKPESSQVCPRQRSRRLQGRSGPASQSGRARSAAGAGPDAQSRLDEFKRTYPAKLRIRLQARQESAGARRFWFPPSTTTTVSPTSSPLPVKSPRFTRSRTRSRTSSISTLKSGVYVVPKIIDSGYLVVGKKRVTFNRNGN